MNNKYKFFELQTKRQDEEAVEEKDYEIYNLFLKKGLDEGDDMSLIKLDMILKLTNFDLNKVDIKHHDYLVKRIYDQGYDGFTLTGDDPYKISKKNKDSYTFREDQHMWYYECHPFDIFNYDKETQIEVANCYKEYVGEFFRDTIVLINKFHPEIRLIIFENFKDDIKIGIENNLKAIKSISKDLQLFIIQQFSELFVAKFKEEPTIIKYINDNNIIKFVEIVSKM